MRLNVQQVWDLAGARCRFGKYLRVEVNGSVPPVAEVLKEHPGRRVTTEQGPVVQGLSVRLVLHRETASAELDLGDESRFFPTDAALAQWQVSNRGRTRVVYDLPA
jgi:DNA polymerase-3 subunit alpha